MNASSRSQSHFRAQPRFGGLQGTIILRANQGTPSCPRPAISRASEDVISSRTEEKNRRAGTDAFYVCSAASARPVILAQFTNEAHKRRDLLKTMERQHLRSSLFPASGGVPSRDLGEAKARTKWRPECIGSDHCGLERSRNGKRERGE